MTGRLVTTRPATVPIGTRLAQMYALRARLDQEISAAEKLAGVEAQRKNRRSRHEIPKCGTETAYQRHRYRGERLDPATDECGCVAAHNEHNRLRVQERKLRIRRAINGLRS